MLTCVSSERIVLPREQNTGERAGDMTNTKATKLSSTMEEALVYLGRGAYQPHLEPATRTIIALEKRGMIRWSTEAELGRTGDVESYRVRDVLRLWVVTEAGWAWLKTEMDMDRPADAGRMTVEEALAEAYGQP